MNFTDIDPIIREWSEKPRVPLYTHYRDEEVRSFQFVGASGQKAQVWVEVTDDITVHAWDYKKRRQVLHATRDNLADRLDEALTCVHEWLGA